MLVEFAAFWKRNDRFAAFEGAQLDSLRQWLQYFQGLDKDGDGTLSAEEIEAFSRASNTPIDINQVMAALDKDGSGSIGFVEFLTWYRIEI